jgi:adenylate kinase family enzyme
MLRRPMVTGCDSLGNRPSAMATAIEPRRAGVMVTSRRRIHILGASGSGTTTLGKALASRMSAAHFDTDNFYWLPTDPPFRTARPREERIGLLGEALSGKESWVLSGSLFGWGDVFIPQFDRVVFLYVPPEVRMARLEAREQERYGARAAPGGDMHPASTAFLAWAAGYDSGEGPERSLARHRAWLATLPCPVLEIAGTQSAAETLEMALAV